MRISILCNNLAHPVVPYLRDWIRVNRDNHEIELIESIRDASWGDILFLVSCSEKVLEADRARYCKTLILHASDLPNGRGWSPHVWDIIEGADHITLSLLEAEDVIDSGNIWKKLRLKIPKHALWSEINQILFNAEIELIDFALRNFASIIPKIQDLSTASSYRRRRTYEDSRVDPNRTIAEQFDLLRVCDPVRFPAFFDYLGHRYTLKLEKANE